MPSASETLNMIKESSKGPASKKRTLQDGVAQPSGAAASSNGTQDDLLIEVIKDHLYWKQEAQHIVDSGALVVLFKNMEISGVIDKAAEVWHDKDPERPAVRGQKKDQHPMGPKKAIMLMVTAEIIEKKVEKIAPPDPTNVKEKEQYDALKLAVQWLRGLSTDEWDREVHSYKSKYRKPMQGRTWKWTLATGTLSSEGMRSAWRTIASCFKDPDNELVIDVKRSMQSEGEKLFA